MIENDLISRSALLKDVTQSFDSFIHGAYFRAACDAIRAKRAVVRMLHDALAVDAEPVRHGRWCHLGGDEWCCSNCYDVIHTEGSWEKPAKKYCSECGAKMDIEVKHETLDPEPS